MAPYPTLPGFYEFLFVWLEPLSETGPLIGCMMYGPSWFYNELVPPTGPPPTDLDPRTSIAIWQLTVAYFLMFLITSSCYRFIRSTLSKDLAGQERFTAAVLGCLGIIDIMHFLVSFIGLPSEHKFRLREWNTTTHGNVSFVVFLHLSRIAWFMGVGRERFYFGKPKSKAA